MKQRMFFGVNPDCGAKPQHSTHSKEAVEPGMKKPAVIAQSGLCAGVFLPAPQLEDFSRRLSTI